MSATAAAVIVIKVPARTESSLTIASTMVILLIAPTLLSALWVWQTPSLAQLLMTQALKEAEATIVLSLDVFKLVWATILGSWLFGELPDRYTWIGGIMIFMSATYIAYRERALRRSAP